MTQVQERILIGTILMASCVGLMCLDYALDVFYFYYVLVAFLVGVALYEFYCLVEKRGLRPHKYLAVLCGTVLALSSKELWFKVLGMGSQAQAVRVATGVSLLAVSVLIIGVFLQQILKRCANDALTDISITFFGVVYIGFLGSFFIKIRHLYDGRPLEGYSYELSNYLFVLMVIFCCKGGDIAAYLFGRKFGRRPLIKEISPKKTVEGAVAALVFGTLVGLGWGLAFGPWLRFRWYYGIIFGLVLAGAGLFGDLAESLAKRRLEAKDSANLIPTFGGILDVIDAPLFAAPAAYYAWVLIYII